MVSRGWSGNVPLNPDAGSMAAGGSGLQASTLRNIALAWVLTLPASLFLGAALFLLSRACVG